MLFKFYTHFIRSSYSDSFVKSTAYSFAIAIVFTALCLVSKLPPLGCDFIMGFLEKSLEGNHSTLGAIYIAVSILGFWGTLVGVRWLQQHWSDRVYNINNLYYLLGIFSLLNLFQIFVAGAITLVVWALLKYYLSLVASWVCAPLVYFTVSYRLFIFLRTLMHTPNTIQLEPLLIQETQRIVSQRFKGNFLTFLWVTVKTLAIPVFLIVGIPFAMSRLPLALLANPDQFFHSRGPFIKIALWCIAMMCVRSIPGIIHRACSGGFPLFVHRWACWSAFFVYTYPILWTPCTEKGVMLLTKGMQGDGLKENLECVILLIALYILFRKHRQDFFKVHTLKCADS